MSSQLSHPHRLRKPSQPAQTKAAPCPPSMNFQFMRKFVFAWVCLALTLLLTVQVTADEAPNLVSLVEESFAIISKPDASESERRAALDTLGKLKKSDRREAAEVLLPYLNTIHIYEQLALPRAYNSLGKVALPTLTNSVESTDKKRTRRVGIFVLGEMRDPKSISTFLDMLSHEDWLTRRAAVGAIGKLNKHAHSYAPQLHTLANDKSEVVRVSVAIALGRLKNNESAVVLGAMLRDPYFSVRFTAAASLAQLGKPGRMELEKALASNNESARYAALTALDKSLARKVAPVLITLLDDEAWPVRARAHQVLNKIAAQKINMYLQEANRNETHPGLTSALNRKRTP